MRITNPMRAGMLTGLLMLALVLAGCDTAPDSGPDEAGTEPPSVEERLAAELAPPGVYDLPGGRAQVIGTLVRANDLEGGFWAIALRTPDSATDVSPVVLANAEIFTQPPIESLDGAYVVAEGSLLKGASIRMAGPELAADTLSRIEPARSVPGEGRWLRGVPPRWARIEKPGIHEQPNGSFRAVGVLATAKSADAAGGDSWVILNEMPFGTGGQAETLAVLTEGPFGDPSDSTWNGAYAGVVGDVIGLVQSGSQQQVPVIRVVDAEVVTRQQPTTDEVFD